LSSSNRIGTFKIKWYLDLSWAYLSDSNILQYL